LFFCVVLMLLRRAGSPQHDPRLAIEEPSPDYDPVNWPDVPVWVSLMVHHPPPSPERPRSHGLDLLA
jgi:hypothetical protein